MACSYKAVGYVMVVGHHAPEAGVCHLVLSQLLEPEKYDGEWAEDGVRPAL